MKTNWHTIPRLALTAGAIVALTLTLLSADPQVANPAVAQPTFATPEEAIHAVADAAEHNDTAAMLKLFGPAGKEIVETGDDAGTRDDRANFAKMAREKMQVDRDPTNPNRVTFSVGAQDWPFPVPLARNKAGRWYFDAGQGKMEVLARRIGRNELNAVEVCRGYVEAQLEYSQRDRDADGILEYAQKIVSSPGKQDGLYWEGAPYSLVPKSFAGAAEAVAEHAGSKPEPYHGYVYRILKAQGPAADGGAVGYVVKSKMIGGFALVAYPAEYGVTGVKTFIVNHSGIVYEKDLGPTTATLAHQMTQFNPDKGWHPVDKE
jgi:hypothetical protein